MRPQRESNDQRSVRLLFFCAVAALGLLQACGSGAQTSSESTSAPSTTVVPTAPSVTTAAPTTQAPAIDAATSYLRRCGGCHGAEGTAQGAQTLAGVGSLPESYVLEKVMTGGGGMPSFGELLEQAEIDAIVAYVRASF